MKRYLVIFIFLIFSFLPLYNNAVSYAATDGVNVNLDVDSCNNNSICEINETVDSCPLDCTIVPPPPPSGGGGGVIPEEKIVLSNLSVVADFNNAFVYWKSSIGTMSTLKWGETAELKAGTLSTVAFSVDHKMEIINLRPGTMYFFTIESQDKNGRTSVYGPAYFLTKSLKDTSFPLSPLNVRATADILGITISWINPPDDNFSYVRIMRHEDRFYGDPFSGKLIYEGGKEKFLDKNVTPGKKYFYVLFSRDSSQNFSTGVGVSAVAFSPSKIFTPPNKTTSPVKEISIPPVPVDFFVHQYNQQVEKLSNIKTIIIENNKSTVVDTNTKTFPDDWIRITNQEGKIVGEYLFSFNKDSNRYQSVLPPLPKGENFNIKIYRYKENITNIIGEGKLYVKENIVPQKEETNGYSYIFYLIIAISLFFLLLLVFLLLRRRKKTQQNKALNDTI